MPYKNKEDQKKYYHRTQKHTLKKWRKKSAWWNEYQKKYKNEKVEEGVTRAWASIRKNPIQHKKQNARSLKFQKENRDILNERDRIRTANLEDQYVKEQLRKEGVTNEMMKTNPEIIEAKRILLKIKRAL